MAAAQLGQLPGKNYTTLNVVAGIHTLHSTGGIRQTVKAFCEKYQYHICKEVHYYFDHTAVGGNPIAKSFYETAIDEFGCKDEKL